RRPGKAAQHAQQGRFAGAVVADDGDTLALAHRQAVDVQHRAFAQRAAHAEQFDAGAHASACRMRRLMASKPDTITTITISTVASRPHWNSAVASVISRPKPPAPMRPRMVE